MNKTIFERWLNDNYSRFKSITDITENSTYSSGKERIKNIGNFIRRNHPKLFNRLYKEYSKEVERNGT